METMTKFIGITQLKGGAGRSTVATNLAAGLAKKGPTLLIDGDMPQGTAASWYSVREGKELTGELSIETIQNHKDLASVINKHSGDFEYIVIDTPPRVAEVTNAVLMLADLVIIPIGASAADLWATGDLLDSVNDAEQQRENFKARVLWNKYRSYTKSTQELTKEVKKELPIKAMKTTLGLRVAYSDLLGEGLSGFEAKDRNAKEEVYKLTQEVMRLTR